jgi:hypothetical protein
MTDYNNNRQSRILYCINMLSVARMSVVMVSVVAPSPFPMTAVYTTQKIRKRSLPDSRARFFFFHSNLSYFWFSASGCGTVVEHSTHNPKTEGSNPTVCTGREIINGFFVAVQTIAIH